MSEPDAVDELGAEEEFADADIAHRFGGLVERELGADAARTLARVWRAQEEYQAQRRAGEGLRERKKRVTRQRISDVATTMFVARGFDDVTLAEVAEQVGVSEKTIYNYFPTKESLVFDQTEEQIQQLSAAVRGRAPGVSPSAAMVAAIQHDTRRLEAMTDGSSLEFLTRFGDMIHGSPALRAAWAEGRTNLVEALTAILAEEAGVDPRDPEPIAAARALVAIQETYYESFIRHISDGLSGTAVRAAVDADLERTARLFDTGLWSFHLMVQGRRTKDQLIEAAVAAEAARKQVVAALRDAKRAWREERGRGRDRERGRDRDRRNFPN